MHNVVELGNETSERCLHKRIKSTLFSISHSFSWSKLPGSTRVVVGISSSLWKGSALVAFENRGRPRWRLILLEVRSAHSSLSMKESIQGVLPLRKMESNRRGQAVRTVFTYDGGCFFGKTSDGFQQRWKQLTAKKKQPPSSLLIRARLTTLVLPSRCSKGVLGLLLDGSSRD